MTALVERTGHKYGRLTVLGRAPNNKHGHPQWHCECVCGTKLVRSAAHIVMGVKAGHNSSCIKCSNVTHNMSGTAIYSVWAKIVDRTTNTNNPGYENYGAKGRVLSPEWRSFENFYKDMGDPPKDGKRYTVERKNNNLGYSKENCRWATYKEQSRNRSNSLLVNYYTEKLPLIDLCEREGISYKSAWWHYSQKKKTVEQIVAYLKSK